jgi:hypothetical protein
MRDDDLFSLVIMRCELSISMKNSKRAIMILLAPNLHPDIVAAILIRTDLKD